MDSIKSPIWPASANVGEFVSVFIFGKNFTTNGSTEVYFNGIRQFLVAPVTTEGATTRDVYLPPGSTWFDVWTGESHDGGQTVTVDAPLGSPPVFSRDADRADLRAIE